MRLYILLFLTSIFCVSLDSSAQTNQKEYYIWFDSIVGHENTGIFNGVRYKGRYRVLNEQHKFYLSNEYQKATIQYFNQLYFNIDVKYDLFEDQLIVKLYSDSGSSILQLIKADIQGFQISNKTFKHIKNGTLSKSSNKLSGFFEVLSEGNQLQVLKKHRKLRNRILDKSVFSEFKKADQYFILKQNVFYQVNNKSDFVKLFPEQKKIVNTYFNNNKNLLKTDYERFIIQLSKKIEVEYSNSKYVN